MHQRRMLFFAQHSVMKRSLHQGSTTGRDTVDKYVERKSKTCYTQYSWFSFKMNLPNKNDATQISNIKNQT